MPKTQPINSLTYVGESDPLLSSKASFSSDDTEGTVGLKKQDLSTKFGLGKASFNIITIVMGAGVLNLPKAVGDTGWMGVLLLVLMGVLSGYTSIVLAKCMYEDRIEGEPDYPTYTDVGERAFGSFGKWFVSFQVHLTLVGVATIFLILCASFLSEIVEFAGGQLSGTHSALIIAAFLWFHVWFDNLNQLGNLSFLSVVATLILVLVVVVDVIMNVDPNDRGEHEIIKIQPAFWSSFVAFAFSFGAHPVLPSVVKDMREPHKYPMMSSVTFLIITLSYLPITIIGYWAFGDDVASPILDNVGDGAMKTSSIVCLLLNLLISYAVCLYPSEQALEKSLEKPLKLDQPTALTRVKKVLMRTVFVGVTLGIAIAIPDFPLVLDLVASLTNTFTVFVLPCAFHSKIFYRKLSWPCHVVNGIVILIGFVACGFGTTNAIRNLIG